MSQDLSFLDPEQAGALKTALKILSGQRRIMLTLVPEHASNELCKRVTTWIGFILDTGLLPPMAVPATKVGDGLHCPYCGAGIHATFPKRLSVHKPDCEWRQAVERWSYANVQIDKEHNRDD